MRGKHSKSKKTVQEEEEIPRAFRKNNDNNEEKNEYMRNTYTRM